MPDSLMPVIGTTGAVQRRPDEIVLRLHLEFPWNPETQVMLGAIGTAGFASVFADKVRDQVRRIGMLRYLDEENAHGLSFGVSPSDSLVVMIGTETIPPLLPPPAPETFPPAHEAVTLQVDVGLAWTPESRRNLFEGGTRGFADAMADLVNTKVLDEGLFPFLNAHNIHGLTFDLRPVEEVFAAPAPDQDDPDCAAPQP